MSSKYIVRQPIKDSANHIVGYEILYHGENQAFGSGDSAENANDLQQQIPSIIVSPSTPTNCCGER